MGVRVTTAPFDPGAETNGFLVDSEGAGAAVTFTGLVRSLPDDPISGLELECYEELALNEIGALVARATERFGLLRIDVIHRYGKMQPGEPIVQVMAMAAHRRAAFEGAEFVMDVLKTDAPFWKKESRSDGVNWVDATSAGDGARARWDVK